LILTINAHIDEVMVTMIQCDNTCGEGAPTTFNENVHWNMIMRKQLLQSGSERLIFYTRDEILQRYRYNKTQNGSFLNETVYPVSPVSSTIDYPRAHVMYW